VRFQLRPVEVDTGRGIYSLGTLPGSGGAPRCACGDEIARAIGGALELENRHRDRARGARADAARAALLAVGEIAHV